VHVEDDGGTANGGVDTNLQTITLNVEKPRPWQNTREHLDVTDDGHVVAGDALEIINYINAFRSGRLPAREVIESPYYDANGDQFIAPNSFGRDRCDQCGCRARRIFDGTALVESGMSNAVLNVLAADWLFTMPVVKRVRR
jgi:hypothetical protein